jgi:hypothetical protein
MWPPQRGVGWSRPARRPVRVGPDVTCGEDERGQSGAMVETAAVGWRSRGPLLMACRCAGPGAW